MSIRKRFFLLLGILTAVAVGTGTITLKVLYEAAFEEEKERLAETAESQARLIEAIARFDENYSRADVPGGAFEATLSQLREAHSQFKGFGETGEFTLARLEGDSIIFLLSHRHGLRSPKPVSITGQNAEPMRRALSGQCGIVVDLDYRGKMVLAAYEPVAVLNLGIVAKIDLDEIRAPFVRAGIVAGCVAAVLVFLGAILFLRVGMPLVHRLEESEKKYRQVFSAESDAILLFDAETLQVLDANPAALELYGYDHDEFLNLRIQDITAEPEKTLAAIAGVCAGDNEMIPFRLHKKKDGTVFPIEVSPGSFNLGDRKIICGIVRDMTERKHAEEALRRSEEQFRTLVESNPYGFHTLDVDGGITYSNSAYQKMLGYSAEELLGKSILDLQDCDEARVKLQAYLLMLVEDQPEPTTYEQKNQTKDGRIIEQRVYWYYRYDDKGRVNGFAAIITDITERKQAELALKESEAKYRAIVDNALDPIVLIDPDTGRLVQFNSEAPEMLGYSREEFQELTIADIDATETPEEVAEHTANILRKGSDRFETQMRAKSGELKDVLVSVTAISIKGRQYLSSMWRDITVQKRADEMRKQQHEFLQNVIDSLDHPLYVIDPADYTIKLANAACKVRDYEDGMTCHRLFHGCRVPCGGLTQPCPTDQVMASKKPVTVEHQHVDRQGKPRFSQISAFPILDSEDNVTGIIEYAVDITDRKLVEGVLRANEERFRALIDQAGDAFFLMRTDGTLIDVNQRACEALGYSRDELLELSVPDFNPPFSKERCAELTRGLQPGSPATIESIHRRNDGTTFPVEIRVGLVEFHGSKTVLALARDISERKAVDAALTASLMEKETLLKEIHHRVKNNLQVISSLLRIQSDFTEDQEVVSVLEASQVRVNSMALIHEQLYRSANLAEIDFTEYVQKLTERLLASYGVDSETIKMELSIRDMFLSIDTAIPCGLILTELISNALKHAFPDGRSGQITVSCSPDGNQYSLTVSDTGIGMPPEVDPKNSPSLGLQLVDMLTKQLDGYLEIKIDQGTSFSLVFPKETETADSPFHRAETLELV